MPFPEHQRIKLLTSDDISKDYIELDFWYSLREAQKTLNKAHNYLIYNKIFLSADLFDKFTETDLLMKDVLLDKEMGKENTTAEFRRDATIRIRENMQKIKPLLSEIEELVQKRLHYPDA